MGGGDDSPAPRTHPPPLTLKPRRAVQPGQRGRQLAGPRHNVIQHDGGAQARGDGEGVVGEAAAVAGEGAGAAEGGPKGLRDRRSARWAGRCHCVDGDQVNGRSHRRVMKLNALHI
jgi:hypothetical protein